jgi:hypothetical protein
LNWNHHKIHFGTVLPRQHACNSSCIQAETDIVGFCALCQRAGLLDHVMTLQVSCTFS